MQTEPIQDDGRCGSNAEWHAKHQQKIAEAGLRCPKCHQSDELYMSAVFCSIYRSWGDVACDRCKFVAFPRFQLWRNPDQTANYPSRFILFKREPE